MYVSVTALETLFIEKVDLKRAGRSCDTTAAVFKLPPLEKQTCQRNESDNAHKRNDLHNKLVRLLLRDVYFKNLVGDINQRRGWVGGGGVCKSKDWRLG